MYKRCPINVWFYAWYSTYISFIEISIGTHEPGNQSAQRIFNRDIAKVNQRNWQIGWLPNVLSWRQMYSPRIKFYRLSPARGANKRFEGVAMKAIFADL